MGQAAGAGLDPLEWPEPLPPVSGRSPGRRGAGSALREPPALLLLETQREASLAPDLLDLPGELAPGIRQVLDRWLQRSEAEDPLRILQAEAHIDPLTGVLNRRAVRDQPLSGFRACLRTADRALCEAKRLGGDAVVVQEPPDPPMAIPPGHERMCRCRNRHSWPE